MQDKPQRKSVSTGDVWQLGAHRVVCGDAMNPDDVKEAVGGGRIRQILTDPPYGVAYVENKAHFKSAIGANLSNTTVILGDQLQSDQQYEAFTKAWLDCAIPSMDSYNTVYIFNSDLMFCALRHGMKAAFITVR